MKAEEELASWQEENAALRSVVRIQDKMWARAEAILKKLLVGHPVSMAEVQQAYDPIPESAGVGQANSDLTSTTPADRGRPGMVRQPPPLISALTLAQQEARAAALEEALAVFDDRTLTRLETIAAVRALLEGRP